ncbi:MAG: hypothetical protein Q9213_000020 [Squamulea squamosa]
MASTRQIRIYEDSSVHDSTNILLEPSVPAAHGRSPLKSSQSKVMPAKTRCGPLKDLSLPPPEQSRLYNHSPTKGPLMNAYHGNNLPDADTAVFGDLPPLVHFTQEILHPSQHSDNCAAFPDPTSVQVHASSNQDRAITSTAPRQGRKSKSIGCEPMTTSHLPEPEELPTPEDHFGKPNYSYASLIGMSILRAPGRRLTLNYIYKWISDTFSYYSGPNTRWQNSIRHNLSINKAFIKEERPKDDPGKGHYWIIKPGMEAQFLKEKPSRRPPSAGGPTMKTFSQPLNEPSPIAWSTPANTTFKPVEQAPTVSEVPSSDGTIPASDAVSPEEIQEPLTVMPPPAPCLVTSSPSPAIGSSPPIELHTDFGEASPSLASEFLLPSAPPRTKKRKSTAMDDSGYFSSLESSVIKNSADTEADRPRLKRGRAEEEIARIRSSSHDLSPTKGRSIVQPLTPQLASSSPLPDFEAFLMPPPPLTPGVAFVPPPQVPTSISPHTHLKNHRKRVSELFGVPSGIMDTLTDEVMPSPEFDFGADGYYKIGLHSESRPDFSIFADSTLDFYPRSLSASPEKRSAHRPRPARPGKLSSALRDVTDARLNRTAMAPPFQAPDLDSPLRKISRAKHSEDQENWCSPVKEDLPNLHWFIDDDDEQDENTGFDLTQGFQKIGQNQYPGTQIQKAIRPLLGARSHTSRF